jgi:hypothetical protein
MRAIGLIIAMICATGTLVACGNDRAESYTLYRNSPFDHAMRVHWATFDANDKGSYNMNNCLMAVRLLNANVTASAKAEGKERDSLTGFWCEAGPFKEEGPTQTSFPEAFPTDA